MVINSQENAAQYALSYILDKVGSPLEGEYWLHEDGNVELVFYVNDANHRISDWNGYYKVLEDEVKLDSIAREVKIDLDRAYQEDSLNPPIHEYDTAQDGFNKQEDAAQKAVSAVIDAVGKSLQGEYWLDEDGEVRLCFYNRDGELVNEWQGSFTALSSKTIEHIVAATEKALNKLTVTESMSDKALTIEELAEAAVGIILAGSEDWSSDDLAITGDIEAEDDGLCYITFYANNGCDRIGTWDIDLSCASTEADLQQIVSDLDNVSAELEAALTGMGLVTESAPAKSTHNSDSLGADCVFRMKDSSYWLDGDDVEFARAHDGKICCITSVDVESEAFEDGAYSVKFEDGTTLEYISGIHLQLVRDAGMKYIFKALDPGYWMPDEQKDVLKYDGKRCRIVANAVTASTLFDENYYDIQFEDGSTLGGVCGMHLKKLANESKKVVEGMRKSHLTVGDVFDNAGETFEVVDYNDADTLLVGLDKDGNRKKRWIVAWGMDTDGSWGQGHYFWEEADARKAMKRREQERRRAMRESKQADEITVLADAHSTGKRQPDPGRCWIRVRRRDCYDPEFFIFGDLKTLEQITPEYDKLLDALSAGYGPGIVDVALGCTLSNGKDSNIMRQNYVDNLRVESLKESKYVSEDPIAALAKLGYHPVEGDGDSMLSEAGEIELTCDYLYSPNIVLFGNLVEICPLDTDELPLTMTVEDHGKMVARLAQIQKAVEDLR